MRLWRSIDTDQDLLDVVKILNPRRPLANYPDVFATVKAIMETMMAGESLSPRIALDLLFHFLYVIGDPMMSRQLARYCQRFFNSEFIIEINRLLSGDPINGADMVRATYLMKSAYYDAHTWPGATVLPELLATLPLDRMGNAADLGCGTGRAGAMLRQAGFGGRLIGVDLSAHMLKEARSKGDYQELIEANLIDWLDGTEERFDLMIVFWVTAHLTLYHLRRMISKVGTVVTGTGTGTFLVDTHLVATEASKRGDRFFSVTQFEAELRRAGFSFHSRDGDGNRFYVCTRRRITQARG